jgi:hypothetical protein
MGEEKKRKKREREKWQGYFFLGLEAGHVLLIVPGRIFVVAKCN